MTPCANIDEPARAAGVLSATLDTLALRAQARLDADWADHTLSLADGRGAVRRAVRYDVGGGAPARRGPGAGPVVAGGMETWVLGRPVNTSSLTGNELVEEQWSFVALPVLWLSRCWIPTPQLLGGIQALALSLAVIPLSGWPATSSTSAWARRRR